MNFYANILDKTTFKPVAVQVEMEATRYSWNSKGGPDDASLSLRGKYNDLVACGRYLGNPVEIYDNQSVPVWWGYVYSLETRWGSRTINMSLGSMSNRVCAVYSKKVAGKETKAETAWVSDATSISLYGTKEKRLNLGDSSDSAALNAANTYLLYHKYPRQVMATGQSQGGSDSGLMQCRGWYWTINWKYYSNAGEDTVDNGTQVGDIITTSGQFLTLGQIFTIGVSTVETRDGKKLAGQSIDDLVVPGCFDGRRIVTEVDRSRIFRMWRAPQAETIELYVDEADTWFTPYGAIMPKAKCPVGKWFKTSNMPTETSVYGIFDPTSYFIQRSTYDTNKDSLIVEPLDSVPVFGSESYE